MEKFNRRFGGIVILFLANAVFAALYWRFLTGEAVYLYSDIGSDGLNSSYPIIAMLQRLLSFHDFSGYSITNGLGASTTAYLLKYLNPMKLPLLFFTGSRLPLGLTVELLIQTNVTALFSWFFFRRLLDHGTSALFASLAWSFSGYVTLWSQNLTTGSCMAMFTVVMAALLPVIMKPTVRRCLLLSVSLALFLLTNYYYCYMSAFFVLAFLIFYSIAEMRTVTAFFVSGLEILGAAVFAAALALFSLVPSIGGFASSGRTDSFSVLGARIQLMKPRELFTLLARVFSVNTMGCGNAYNGTMNYYEEAALSVTILAFVAVIYLISQENTRFVTILACAAACASLIIKNTGAFIQFNIGVQRFSFMIAFAEAIAVGVFIKSIMTRAYGIPLFWSVIVALALEAGIFLFLAVFDTELGFRTELEPLKIAAAAAVVFSALLIIYAFGFRISAVIPYLMLGVLMAELVVMNYPTVYNRSYITAADYEKISSAEGIKEASEQILSADSGLYRIAAVTDPDDANTGMLLGFPAASVYCNVNTGALRSLTKAHGTCQLSPNHFVADAAKFGQLSFMSGKYVIVKNDGTSASTPVSAFYEKRGETADGKYAVYENKTALPFGYFYTEQISAAEAKELELPLRIAALTRAYYRTDGISRLEDSDESSSGFRFEKSLFKETDLLTAGTSANHLKQRKTSSGIVFRPTGGDPYLYYDIGKAEEGSVRMLYMRLKSTNFNHVRHMQMFFMSSPDEDPDPADSMMFFLGRGYPEICLILPDDAERIRLDFPEDYLDTSVTELAVVESSQLPELFVPGDSASLTGVSMSGGTYSAKVTAKKSGMLCIPLLYSDNWTASVNGVKTGVENINGGLVGIPLSEGTSEVALVWQIPYFGFSVIFSGVAFAAAIVLFIAPPFRKRRRRS